MDPTTKLSHRHATTKPWLLVSLLLPLFWSATAWGYVLSGPHILELVARNLAGTQSLTVHQQIIVDDPLVSAEPIVMSEELNYLFPDQFRSEIHHQDTHRIVVVSRDEALVVVDGQIVGDQQGRFDRYKDLLLYRSRQLLHKALLTHGVDVGITSLGRLGDRVVYVIGAQYPDDSVSQIWIDKERLLPLRWLSVVPKEGMSRQYHRLEFIYDKWQQLDDVWYPLRIDSIYNDQRLRTIEVRRVEANAPIAGELLNISHLMSLYAAEQTLDSADDNTTLDVDEVERTIEEFRKKFEP